MKSTIMCYQQASADYVLDIINILKLDDIQIAPMWALRDFTITHGYTSTSRYDIFTPRRAAGILMEYMNDIHTMTYDRIYLTHDITYISNHHWMPSFIRSENNYIVRTCNICMHRVDDICTKENKEIINLQIDGFPEWCPLTDCGLTYNDFINKYKNMGIDIMDVSEVECSHCGRLVDRLELKQYLIESTGERFAICKKCAKNEDSIY